MKKNLLIAACLVAVTAFSAETVKDPAVYTDVNGYSLKNLWMKSVKTLNDPSAALGEARGMAAYNGELLFCKRAGSPAVSSIDIYDAITGDFKKNLILDSGVFTYLTKDRFGNDSIATKGIPCNDIQVDDAGNVLVAELSTNVVASGFQVWKIDMNTGKGVKIIDCKLPFLSNGAQTPTIRIDAFGVSGDVAGNGYVMAAVSGDVAGVANQVLRWNFENGQPVVSMPDFVADPEAIANPTSYPLIIALQKYYPATVAASGAAPRVCPIDNDYFYLDGFTCAAALYNMDGVLVDSFENATALAPLQVGNNGVDEFSLNGKDFIIYSYTNTVPTVNPQAWSLAEMGPGPAFAGMSGYFIFPAAGVGTTSNPVRTALPRIDVKSTYNVAVISVYAYKSGFGTYVFGKTADVNNYLSTQTSVESVTSSFTVNSVSGGIQLSEPAAVKIYNFVGQQLISGENMSFVALASGQYIVKAVTADGKIIAEKVIVK